MTFDEIKKTIEDAVPNSTAYILDPMDDGKHLQALVVSPTFENLSLVKQHQMVMRPLKDAFHQSVHALGLKTFTPTDWEEKRKQYRL